MKAYILPDLKSSPALREVNIPSPSESEVILKLSASAINHRDIWITQGLYPGIRVGAVMGSDGCGTLDGVEYIINPGLSWGLQEAFQGPDFRVLGVPDDGTFAEYIAIDRKYIYPKPPHLTSYEAAALPLAGVTAYRALMKKAGLQPGEKVLISGIGGGVALFALQFALALGCEVYVTSGSEEKISKAISLGAKAGYSYLDPDWPKKLLKDAGGVDVIIDGACGIGFNQLVKTCNPGARISFYGGTAGKIDGLNPQFIFWKQISILGSTMGSPSDFEQMMQLVTDHYIRPVVDEVIPFGGLLTGLAKLSGGKHFGKIVIDHAS